MGWWGYGIMEGDTPCDAQCDILFEAAPRDLVEQYKADGYNEQLYDQLLAAGINALQAEQVRVLEAIECGAIVKYDERRAIQVLAYLLMTNGSTLDNAVRTAAKAATTAEIQLVEGDGWDVPERRITALESFLQCLNTYDGKAVEFDDRGLFETIFSGEAS